MRLPGTARSRLSPNDANVLRPIGAQLALATGVERAAQGVELVERAMRLDPLHPPNVASALGFACYYAGCHEKGIVAFKRRASMNVDHHVFLAMSYAQLGRKEEAAVEVAEVLREAPDFAAEAWVERDFFQPGGSSAALFFDGARKAGLPLCAPAAEAARFDPRNRLSECEAERAKAAAPRRNLIRWTMPVPVGLGERRQTAVTAFRHGRQPRAVRISRPKAAAVRARGPC